MKILITKLFGAALLLSSATLFAEPVYYSVTNIPENNSLTLRAWPSQVSQALASIPHNTQQLVTTGRSIVLDDVNWLQISFAESTGWVEESYLRPTQTSATIDTAPASNQKVLSNVEVFSYASPDVVTVPPPQATKQQYPWSAEADTIYDNPQGSEQVDVVVVASTPINEASSDTSNQLLPAETSGSTIQAKQPEEAIILTQTPRPLAISGSTRTEDVMQESLRVNRYNTIETASSGEFIAQ